MFDLQDLHRTGSTLCTGPAGDINQAKLKKILLGYARYNPEVGYCQVCCTSLPIIHKKKKRKICHF